jgi:hypothetical protein
MAIDKLEFSYQDEGRTLKIFTNGAGELKPAWQGLTYDEVENLANFWNISDIGIEAFIAKIEHKLKEKNHG